MFAVLQLTGKECNGALSEFKTFRKKQPSVRYSILYLYCMYVGM